MLAYYYQLKIKPQHFALKLCRLTKTTSRMRRLLLLFYVLMIGGFGAQQAAAQDLRTFPDPICLNSATTTSMSNLSTPYDSIEFDYDGDGIREGVVYSPALSYTYIYASSGTKTIGAKVYAGGVATPYTASASVVKPPTAAANLLTNATQCFIGNVTEIENISIPGDRPISKIEIIWGDAKSTNASNPTSGQKFTHNYTAMGQFIIDILVYDDANCQSPSSVSFTVTIKQDLTPAFAILGSRGCMKSCYTFANNTPVAFSDLQMYTWDFGDGTVETRQRPFVMPKDSIEYFTITHCYTKPGQFSPSLYIEDVTGCKGKHTAGPNDNLPENIFFEFDITPTFTNKDTLPRADSACFGSPHESTIFFRQTPVELAKPGEWLWTFDNPASAPLNLNQDFGTTWWPGHQFLRDNPDKCDFKIKLRIMVPPCDTTDSIYVRILAPKAQIEDPPVPIVVHPDQKTQCVINNMVEFPNTSAYCYAEHVWKKWDFADDFAPRCTSFLVPNPGFPPAGGWVYNMNPPQAITNSHGYFIQNGKTYAGKRVDCNYSHDTLPVHKYEDWDKIYEWYRDGHDFMPWDTTRYTRNPADTGSAPGSKFWVDYRDTMLWGKPVYLNITTGEFTLVQGTYNDPIYGLIPFPRIDTIASQEPQDLEPWNRITITRGVPDPFTLDKGDYNVIQSGLVDPKNQPNGFQYFADGILYTYPYNKRLNGQSGTLDLHKYIFYREVQKCHTVRLYLKDSSNNGSTGMPQSTSDYLVLDTSDCGDDAQVQLALVRPDARGLGYDQKECTGSYNPSGSNGNGIRFRLDGVPGTFPGINPNCGQSFILLNVDSMADREDATPCTLDGFASWQGGTTPGGLNRPAFNTNPDWQGTPWQLPSGTVTWWHYGPLAPQGAPPPADPTGYVTVGLVIGAGNNAGQPLCISDTVWYHNFLFFRKANAQFYIDPTYNIVTNAPTDGRCKQYCKNDEVLFVYADTTQDSIAFSYVNWGDNSYTIDSFYYTKNMSEPGYVNGLRRVRHHLHTGTCGTDAPTIYKTEMFPYGVPGLKVDTVWHENYKRRIYHPLTNPNGSLDTLGRNPAGDSIEVVECSYRYWMPLKDTLARWYIPEIRDSAYGMWPFKHQFWTSTFENNCKQPGGTVTPVYHIITTTKKCTTDYIKENVVRGIIDTAMVRNAKLEFDTVFCVDEPVHFYDSVRYWRPDCQISNPAIGLPNRYWGGTGLPLAFPYNFYQYDTTDYWARNESDPNILTNDPFYPYVEKMYWYFGDGDSAMGTKPVHTYKNPGRYIVTMKTFDRMGCWDTSWCYVNVVHPAAKITVPPGLFRCGNPVELWDRSTVLTGGHDNADSVQFNYWWFGERRTADTLTKVDGSNTDTATWKYRQNGLYVAKLVIETYQGCKDTVWQDVFIEGPRPKIKVITDTIGCAPFRVRVVNMADTDGPPTAQKLTRATYVTWGIPGRQSQIMVNQFDTVDFVYNDSGTFYIFAIGDDNNPPSTADCPITFFPDTAENLHSPLKITVKHSYPAALALSHQTVCVDQPFDVINLSDTISYTGFKYMLYTGDTLTLLDSVIKTNTENRFTRSIDSVGRYLILLEPTGVAPGLPDCKRHDTAEINVVKPTASFDIDSTFANRKASEFRFTNTSTGADNYTWVAYKGTDFSNIYKGPEDVVEASRDWSIDMQSDTGDFIICLTAFTADPAKPICFDSVCQKIEFTFVVKMEIFNVFSPNNDGKNDVFNIDIEGETEYDLVIFNRWGTKVFESKDKNIDWTGQNMNDGADCPAGTYFYVFKYGLQSGKKETLNGSITLIREQ